MGNRELYVCSLKGVRKSNEVPRAFSPPSLPSSRASFHTRRLPAGPALRPSVWEPPPQLDCGTTHPDTSIDISPCFVQSQSQTITPRKIGLTPIVPLSPPS